MIEPVALDEYRSCIVNCPTPEPGERARIAAALSGRIQLQWLAGDELQVESGSHVGVVELPGGPRITVRPKLAGGNLNVLRMFALTSNLPPAQLTDLMRRIDTSDDGDLHELICRILCAEVSTVLAYGARRDYRTHRDDLAMVRGRIEVRRQALRHFGRVDRIASRYQEFDHDVADNRILRAAMDLVRRTVRGGETRRLASHLHDDLIDLAPGPAPSSAEFRRTRTYNRQNDHYRPAHHWALVLLEGEQVDDLLRSDGAVVRAFLLDMNRLYEDFLAWLAGRAFASRAVSVTPQRRDRTLIRVDGRPYKTVIPDLLVAMGDRRLAVDAKYKRYEQNSIAPADIYQLLVYAQGYRGFGDLPSSVLAFPTEGEEPHFRIDLVPDGPRTASVECIGIPLPKLLAHIGRDGSLEDPDIQAQLGRLAQAMNLPQQSDSSRVMSGSA